MMTLDSLRLVKSKTIPKSELGESHNMVKLEIKSASMNIILLSWKTEGTIQRCYNIQEYGYDCSDRGPDGPNYLKEV